MEYSSLKEAEGRYLIKHELFNGKAVGRAVGDLMDSCPIETEVICSEHCGAKPALPKLGVFSDRSQVLEYINQPQLFKIFACQIF